MDDPGWGRVVICYITIHMPLKAHSYTLYKYKQIYIKISYNYKQITLKKTILTKNKHKNSRVKIYICISTCG